MEATARILGFLPLGEVESTFHDTTTKEASREDAPKASCSLHALQAQMLYEWNQSRPSPDEFAHIYAQPDLAERKEELILMKKEWEPAGYRALLSEMIIAHAIHSHRWLGHGVSILPVSEYDDVKTHVDFILRAEDNNGAVHYLGVDVTISDDDKVGDKRSKLFSYLREGWLPKVRYFRDHYLQTGAYRGGLQLPSIFLHIEAEDVTFITKCLLRPEEVGEEDVVRLDRIRRSFVDSVREELDKGLTFVRAMVDADTMSSPEQRQGSSTPVKMEEKYTRIINVLFPPPYIVH